MRIQFPNLLPSSTCRDGTLKCPSRSRNCTSNRNLDSQILLGGRPVIAIVGGTGSIIKEASVFMLSMMYEVDVLTALRSRKAQISFETGYEKYKKYYKHELSLDRSSRINRQNNGH
jgi:hypothetical protein